MQIVLTVIMLANLAANAYLIYILRKITKE